MPSVLGFVGPTTPRNWFRKNHTLTKQFVAQTNPAYSAYSVLDDTNSVAGNTVVFARTVSPSGVGVSLNANGEPVLADVVSGRQSFAYSEYRYRILDWVVVTAATDGITATYYINNLPPQEVDVIASQTAATNVLYEGPVLTDHVIEPEGDVITYSGTLPTGLSVQTVVQNEGTPSERTVQQLRGTPATGQQGTYDITLTATDVVGEATVLTTFSLVISVGVQVPAHTTSTAYATLVADLEAVGLDADLQGIEDGVVTVGNVVSSTPASGAYVAPGSVVQVFVSGVEVPDVRNLPTSNAVSAVTGAGFVAETVSVPAPGVAFDTVAEQIPAANDFAVGGSSVWLFISSTIPPVLPRKRFNIKFTAKDGRRRRSRIIK